MIRRIALIACLLLVAPIARAGSSLVMDFQGKMPGQWRTLGLTTAESTQYGLRIATDADGYLMREVAFDPDTDTVHLWAASPRPADALLLWHLRGDPDDKIIRLPFTFPASETAQMITLQPDRYDEWRPGDIDQFGFAVPAGTELTVARIETEGRGPLERLAEGVRSALTPDEFRLYSINFLWGPLVVTTPLARQQLYAQMPPFGWSALRLVYALLAFAAIPFLVAVAMRWDKRSRLRACAVFGVAFCALWILFDVRMGGEIASYAAADWKQYVSQPPQTQQLRSHGSLYGVLFAAMPLLQEDERFAAFFDVQQPFEGVIRYYAYPSIPLWPGEDLSGVRTFFVFDRPGFGVDAEGRLHDASGTVLSAPGKILLQFAPHTFVFRAGA